MMRRVRLALTHIALFIALLVSGRDARGQSIADLEAKAAQIERAKGANDRETMLAKIAVAEQLTTEGDFDRAGTIVAAEIARAAKLNDGVTRNAATLVQGYIQLARRDNAGAIRTLDPVFQEAERAKDYDTALRAALLLAEATSTSGSLEDVAKYVAAAIAIAEKGFGPSSRESATALLQYAKIMGHLASESEREVLTHARNAAARAVAIEERFAADMTSSLVLLGGLERKLREFPAAKKSLERALRICRASYAPSHPCNGNATFELERVALAEGNAKDGVTWAREDEAATELHFARGSDFGSESQRSAQVENLTSRTYATLTVADRWPNEPGAKDVALLTLLHRKGRVLDGIVSARRASPELAAARAALSRMMLSSDVAGVKAAEAKVDSLEQSAYRGAVNNREPVTIAGVARALPRGAALVEVGRFATFQAQLGSGQNWGEERYAAYVLKDDGAITPVPLGPASLIDDAAKNLRRGLANADQDVHAAARSLDALVFAPIARALGDATTRVFLSLDGSLHTIPFEALTDERDHFRVEHYELSYVTSGRDLLVKASAQPSSGVTVFANPDFDARAGATGVGLLGRARFDPLPATATEGEAVASLLRATTLAKGSEATESALKAIRSPSVLHIASHGFFLSDQNVVTLRGSRGLVLTDAPPVLAKRASTNPLLRTGVALAGANVGGRQTTEDDGVITGLEVTDLDLAGTRLVVLSACETGVGEVRNGEGVFGLRRALALAGSRSQVLSLWKVDDDASLALMRAFYGELKNGQTVASALREAKLKVLHTPQTKHPFYWAAFTASGVPMTLSGENTTTGSRAQRSLTAQGCRCEMVGDPRSTVAKLNALLGAMMVLVLRVLRRRLAR